MQKVNRALTVYQFFLDFKSVTLLIICSVWGSKGSTVLDLLSIIQYNKLRLLLTLLSRHGRVLHLLGLGAEVQGYGGSRCFRS